MKIRYGVEVPRDSGKKMSESTRAIKEFIERRDESTMEIEFENRHDLMKANSSAHMYLRKHELYDRYGVSVRGTKMYVFKREG